MIRNYFSIHNAMDIPLNSTHLSLTFRDKKPLSMSIVLRCPEQNRSMGSSRSSGYKVANADCALTSFTSTTSVHGLQLVQPLHFTLWFFKGVVKGDSTRGDEVLELRYGTSRSARGRDGEGERDPTLLGFSRDGVI